VHSSKIHGEVKRETQEYPKEPRAQLKAEESPSHVLSPNEIGKGDLIRSPGKNSQPWHRHSRTKPSSKPDPRGPGKPEKALKDSVKTRRCRGNSYDLGKPSMNARPAKKNPEDPKKRVSPIHTPNAEGGGL